jgi:hypothetical protein
VSQGSDIDDGPNGEHARLVDNVPRPILLEIVRELQDVLYIQRPGFERPFWNNNKPFSHVDLEALDAIMKKHGLAPE